MNRPPIRFLAPVFLGLVLVLLVGACSQDSSVQAGTDSTDSTDGTDGTDDTSEPVDGGASDGPDGRWVLESLVEDGGTEAPVPEGAEVTLDVDGSQISGRAACNGFGGSATFADDGSLTIGDLFWTEMGCEEPLMSFESRYLAALQGVDSWAVESESLTLFGSASEVDMRFGPAVVPEDAPIVGTHWRLDTFFDGDAATNAVGMDEVSGTFSENGLQLSAPCWSMSGGATIEQGGEGNLSVDLTASDPDFTCDDRPLFDELTERLGAVSEYRVDGHRLTLGAAGADSLGFFADDGS